MPKSPQAKFAGGCSNEKCSIRDPWPLHHLRYHSNFCRFCTSCVLNLHPGFFCTICFSLLDPPRTSSPMLSSSPPPTSSNPSLPISSLSPPLTSSPLTRRTPSPPPPSTSPLRTPAPPFLLMPPSSPSSMSPPAIINCLGCPMVCHLSCLQGNSDLASTYTCPSCKDPSFVYFPKFAGGEKVVDFEAAKVLRLAGKLSLISMEKAAQVAKNEFERKAKEAVEAKRKVREILEKGSLVIPKKVGRKRKSKEAGNSRESYPMDHVESMALSVVDGVHVDGVHEKSMLSGCSEPQKEDIEKEES